MAGFGFPDIGFILLGGRDIANRVIEMGDSEEGVMDGVTGAGDADDNWAYVGVNKSEARLKGIYSDTAIVTAIDSAAASPQELMYALEGNTIGNEGTGIDAVRAMVSRLPERDKLHRVEATFQAATGMDKGHVSASHTARSTAAATSSVDNAASSSDGAVGYLGVSALTLGGYTNVIAKIQDSANDSVWADLITFAAVTSAPASERATVTGTVDRYTRTRHDWTGAGSGESVTYATILKRE